MIHKAVKKFRILLDTYLDNKTVRVDAGPITQQTVDHGLFDFSNNTVWARQTHDDGSIPDPNNPTYQEFYDALGDFRGVSGCVQYGGCPFDLDTNPILFAAEDGLQSIPGGFIVTAADEKMFPFIARFRGFLKVPQAWIGQTVHFAFYTPGAVAMYLFDAHKQSFTVVSEPSISGPVGYSRL